MPARTHAAARLLERLVTDGAFRDRFRDDPAGTCRAAGLPELAGELALRGRAMQTLEVRESRSSLAGLLMAAAAEAIGAVELVHLASSDGSLDAHATTAVREALSRPRLQAVVTGQTGAVHAKEPSGVPAAKAVDAERQNVAEPAPPVPEPENRQRAAGEPANRRPPAPAPANPVRLLRAVGDEAQDAGGALDAPPPASPPGGHNDVRWLRPVPEPDED